MLIGGGFMLAKACMVCSCYSCHIGLWRLSVTLESHYPVLFSILFPFCRGEAGQLSLRSTASFVIFPFLPCCWPFLSTFLP